MSAASSEIYVRAYLVGVDPAFSSVAVNSIAVGFSFGLGKIPAKIGLEPIPVNATKALCTDSKDSRLILLGRVNTIHDIIAINGDHSGAVREDRSEERRV